jgi:hypothetical protein
MRVIVEGANADVAAVFQQRLNRALMEHFGKGQPIISFFSGGDGVEDFIDAVEILAENASTQMFDNRKNRVPIPDVEERINRAFARFRFGYRMQSGDIHKIGSPVLEEILVGPALLAVHRPGWDEVERTYREAIHHQLGGEIDDALTSASSTVESALKAIGMKGSTLKELARSFKASGHVPGYLENVPALLEDFLDRLHALRSTEGDAHGKAPGAADPEAALADLAVHLAGSFIVYLAAIVPQDEDII